MQILWRAGVLFAVLLVLFGCSRVSREVRTVPVPEVIRVSEPKPEPEAPAKSPVGSMLKLDTDVRIKFSVAEDINPDEKQTSSPLVVRFYELESNIAFRQADFIGLFEQDDSILGKDLISKRELVPILPGKSRTDRIVVNPKTRYVALFAEFYEYRNSKYKLVFPVTANNVVDNSVNIFIKDNQLVLRKAR